MSRTNTTFSLLQAVAAIASLAILLWSLGLPSLRFAEAANVTSFSDTLSDSAPAASSTHTIVFTPTNVVANTETITIDFSDGPFVIGSVDFTDIDVATTSDYTIAADCTGSEHIGASFSGTTLTLTFCTGDNGLIPALATTTIQIGTNADFGTTGDRDIVNPAVGSYEINLTSGSQDVGSTRVAIVDSVTVTASVDTQFQFTVKGVAPGVSINGTTTTGSTTPTTIPFGQLNPGVASTAGQSLEVITNAANGFSVTVQADQQLLSSTGADIDSFSNGNNQSTPINWVTPSGTIGSENTYGHWGVTTEDDVAAAFGSQQYVAVSTTTPVEVFSNDGPADGSTVDQGQTYVAYTAKITALQEAGDDYTATLTYVATPVF